MGRREFKDAVYTQIARVGKALSSAQRLEILDLLAQRPWSVEALANECSLSIANASQHLRVLHAAQLVERKKIGSFVEYRLADDHVGALFIDIRNFAEQRFAELPRMLREEFQSEEDRETGEPVDRAELIRRVRDEDAIVVDVRPREE